MHMYFCSGVAAALNGAVSSGSVKLVVVAVALGRQVASPGPAPSGWWMTRNRRGAVIPCARDSIDRSSGASSAAAPPRAAQERTPGELVGAHFAPPLRARKILAIATCLNSVPIFPSFCARRSFTSQVL